MTPLTIVMAYYDNPHMLETHYTQWRSLPIHLRDLLHVVIVDDGSPNTPARPPVDAFDFALQIYRVDVDVRWNQDAARNIGVHHSETEWVLLTDMDHGVPIKVLDTLMSKAWDPRKAFKFARVSAPDLTPYKSHPNSWMMTRKLYDAIGGYDERFAGLYGTDGDFRDRVHKVAGEAVELKEALVRYPRQIIPDASTTTYLRKQPEDREGIARVKQERAAEGKWRPKRLTFPYHRVYPYFNHVLGVG